MMSFTNPAPACIPHLQQDVQDPSVIVNFPLLEDESVCLIAWTTTPWTLPSNLALCVNPELIYVKVKGQCQSQASAATSPVTSYLMMVLPGC